MSQQFVMLLYFKKGTWLRVVLTGIWHEKGKDTVGIDQPLFRI